MNQKSVNQKSIDRKKSKPTVLIIATLDTKGKEALYLKKCIEDSGCETILMNTGILHDPRIEADIPREEVAEAGGATIDELLESQDRGRCIDTMLRGAAGIARRLYEESKIDGVIGIGGAQGTNISTSAMRALPIGFPKLMISTVASGRERFGSYIGTKDINIVHSVTNIQGLNFVTKKILFNGALAISGMVKGKSLQEKITSEGITVALSISGTTTPGGLKTKEILEENGYEVVCFHQNGTGGIAMEDLILEGAFRGVLDLNLHEVGDWVAGGLHGAIRDDRLTAAGKMGLVQVLAPGAINYTVQPPPLSEEMKKRKHVVHNPHHILVRLSNEEMENVGRIVAERLNEAKGPCHFFIPLRGFSFPDREGLEHWDPAGNRVFIDTLKKYLKPEIPCDEINAHINDPEFSEIVVEKFMEYMDRTG